MRYSDHAQPQHQWSPPAWDPEALSADYLISLRRRATDGYVDPKWLEEVQTYLVQQLVRAYDPQRVDEAVKNLERLTAHWLRKAATVQPTAPSQAEMPAAPVKPASSVKRPKSLDGQALQKSIVPTWFVLVLFTWISIVWTLFLSLPTGLTLALLMASTISCIALPVIGTVFGLAGMGFGAGSTLRSIGYEPVPKDHWLVGAASEYAKALAIPIPQLGFMREYNAFAIGTSLEKATVTMGTPLLDQLTEDEARAILGHELGHVVTGDMRRMLFMRTFQNATVWFFIFGGVKQFVRWIVNWMAELFILAASRKREFWADAVGAELAGKEAMISALKKLRDAPPLTNQENRHARFMVRGRCSSMFSTHPTFEERIKALEEETYLKRLPRR